MPSNDEVFMRAALEEAKIALEKGNMPIGCVIVHDGEIVSAGHNIVDSDQTDLGHAEMVAVRHIEQRLFSQLKGKCEVFCTMEPCLMCFGALANYRFKRITFSVSDRFAGVGATQGLPAYYQNRKIEIIPGLLKQETMELMQKYVKQSGRREHLFEWFG